MSSQRPGVGANTLVWMILAFILVLLVVVVAFVLTIQNPSFNNPDATALAAKPSLQPVETLTISPTLPLAQIATATLIPQQTETVPPAATPTLEATQTLTIQASLAATAIVASPPACTTAGQTWIRPTDKMVMVCIPAGAYTPGIKKCTFAGCEKEVSQGAVELPGYWIDRTEVTNRMYAEFILQTGYISGAERLGASEVYGLLTAIAGASWSAPQGKGSSIAARPDHPVVQMNWYSASAYCKWAGGRLPSEVEWEKAARGGDGRLWPWGNALPSDKLVNAADLNVPAPQSRLDMNDGFRYTSPVGAFPAGQSPFGLVDMAGNAWEWTRSVYRDYPYLLNDGREVQTIPAAGVKMVLRGGCWFDDYGAIRSTMRYGGLPEGSTDGTGFRCMYP